MDISVPIALFPHNVVHKLNFACFSSLSLSCTSTHNDSIDCW